MKYKIAIFDMDGTILNTLDDLADSHEPLPGGLAGSRSVLCRRYAHFWGTGYTGW